MNGDQLRSCIPSRLLMALESTCLAAEERFSGYFAKPSAGCFPIAKKQPALLRKPD